MAKRLTMGLVIVAILIVTILGGMIVFGGPERPTSLASIRDAVIIRDRRDLPDVVRFSARDGTVLGYRAYPAVAREISVPAAAVLIHGSVGSSADMHEIAKALSAAGISAYAPDLRGHGISGPRGDIDYIGQLEDDLFDLLDHLDRQGAPARRIIIGHSSGGGFALRVAASKLGTRFSGTMLLAPYLGHDAPTGKHGGGGWVKVGIPRLIALTVLDRLGFGALSGLPVITFAIDPVAAPHLTPAYSYRLMMNFAPHPNWRSDIASTRGPLVVLVGADDQLFYADRFAELFSNAEKSKVEILAGIDHMGITGDKDALNAVISHSRLLLAN